MNKKLNEKEFFAAPEFVKDVTATDSGVATKWLRKVSGGKVAYFEGFHAGEQGHADFDGHYAEVGAIYK